MEKDYRMPRPLYNKGEKDFAEFNKKRYERITEPSLLKKTGDKVSDILPGGIKNIPKQIADMIPDGVKQVPGKISNTELLKKCIEVITDSFSTLERMASNATLSEEFVVNQANQICDDYEIENLNEICLVRVDDIAKLVKKFRDRNFLLAIVEGGATGVFGFAGIAPNLVLSTYMYYRAVQSIALYYGYDVKNDPAELMIATDVFAEAISPSHKKGNELGNTIVKFMALTEVTVVRQTSKKTWADMAGRGGVCMAITQIRALANKAAQNAIKKAGTKAGTNGLEKSVFKDVFEQIGKKLSLKSTGKLAMGVGGIIGAAFDSSSMNQITEYADIFYSKRALVEKSARIDELMGGTPLVIDVDGKVLP